MNLKEDIILIDDKIANDSVSYCNFDVNKNMYNIKYKGNDKTYNFFERRIKVIKKPRLLDLKDCIFYVNNKLLENIKEVYEYEYKGNLYYYVIFKDESFGCKSYGYNEVKILSTDCYNVIKYMSEVSELVSLRNQDGKKTLCEYMKKVKVDSLDTALANYLKLSDDLTKENDIETLIFPFGCNSSQYEAVENAIYNKISIIEGPPGTGKTQTILNIIANVIIRDMNCKVVSDNNSAIKNVKEKLEKYNLDFFEALLGKRENKDLFVEQQKSIIPKFDEYEIMDINDIASNLEYYNQTVKKFYNEKKELALLIQRKSELELEYRYFKELIKSQKIELIELERCNTNKIKLLWNEMISLDKISIWNKIKYTFIYGIGNFEFYNNNINIILKTLQNLIYINDLKEINNQINEKETFIKDNKEIEAIFIKSSMDYFKKYLSMKYKGERKRYSSTEIWKNSERFLNDYPVILSTAYSSRNNFNNGFKFDYIIMDESSQIDVVKGTLALSSAKYAVIIGDEKQLPNVVPGNIGKRANKIFDEYKLDKSYSYSVNSFLSSVKNTIPNVQTKMLVEHYRCHPKIINFCNKKFYNNELVIMTKDNGESDVIKVIKTAKGNHSRDKASQRQVDVIKNILLDIPDEEIGIIAPYNNQVNLIKKNTNNVEVSTVHKFQGREKNTIIISTVEDEIKDFVGDPQILNVAISRAKKHLYFIVTGNVINNSNINDFINYVDYNNMGIVNSKIYSCFDLLYKQYELERLEFFKKHNRISKYDSENIIYHLIKKVTQDYDGLEFHFHQSLDDLIKDKSLLTEEEKRYASHHSTHLDFYIFRAIGEKPILAIEVDGYRNHKDGTRQHERDLLKNSILGKYNIPLLRLETNGSEEEDIIRKNLDEICTKK